MSGRNRPRSKTQTDIRQERDERGVPVLVKKNKHIVTPKCSTPNYSKSIIFENDPTSSSEVKTERLVDEHGHIYEGCVRNGKPSGYGIKSYKNDQGRHEGYYLDGFRHGWGIFQWSNGDKYAGHWLNGLMNGNGVFTWASGDVYTGSWVNGKMTGSGSKTQSDGCIRGHFLDGKIHGFADKEYTCGDKYSGFYVNDRRHGWGKYIWSDGSSYVGDWSDDKVHGNGEHIFTRNQSITRRRIQLGDSVMEYRGNFCCGNRQGSGRAVFQNGDEYEGEWNCNEPCGWGRLEFFGGLLYEGEMIGGLRSGHGVLSKYPIIKHPRANISSLRSLNALNNNSLGDRDENFKIIEDFCKGCNVMALEGYATNDMLLEVDDDFEITLELIKIAVLHEIWCGCDDSIENICFIFDVKIVGHWVNNMPRGEVFIVFSNGEEICHNFGNLQ